jgi:S-adenosyl-L-methionine hydrolase (adenosine-forming)
MSLRYDTVSFLSDYGLADEFVGVVRSVIRSIAPAVVVIDVCHEIAPHDVRAGGLALARSAQYLAPGVVLAVVDPGVGTGRRPVAVEVGDGESVLVGPDNGLLAPAVAMVGGASRAFVLDRPDYHLPAPGPTFAGRDVFAPVAAHLCLGIDPTELGTEVDPATLRPGILPVSRLEDGGLAAEVLWIDRFGNVQLNVDPEELEGWGDRIRLRFGEQTRSARRVTAYDDLKTGEVGLVVDSYGLVSIAVARGSAAMVLRLDAGAAVGLDPGEPDERAQGDTGVDVDVELRRGNGR